MRWRAHRPGSAHFRCVQPVSVTIINVHRFRNRLCQMGIFSPPSGYAEHTVRFDMAHHAALRLVTIAPSAPIWYSVWAYTASGGKTIAVRPKSRSRKSRDARRSPRRFSAPRARRSALWFMHHRRKTTGVLAEVHASVISHLAAAGATFAHIRISKSMLMLSRRSCSRSSADACAR